MPSSNNPDWFNPDLPPEDFRTLGYHVVDMIADHLRTINDVRVFPESTADEVAAVFDEPVPDQGQAPRAVVNAFTEQILPHTTHLGSPRYFAFVNGSGTMMSILGDAMASALNMNTGGWKASPAATEIEKRTLAWLSELIGYAPEAGGILTSGGTMANVTAIATALRTTEHYDLMAHGLQDPQRPGHFRLYMSDHEGHVSIKRVVDLLNLGRETIRLVPSHADFTMDAAALDRMIAEDKAQGDLPFCVVAQAGSINVGAIDPLDAIARVCEQHGVWFHVDGACGAVGAMLPEKRALYKGLEKADSVTLDPHKWLYISYECGCLLVRDPEKLHRAFSVTASYLQGILPTERTGFQFFERGPQMSRGFRALKLWMTIKHYGAEGYRQLLRQNNQCAAHLDTLVRASDDFEALHEPTLYIYSFRYAPPDYRARAQRSAEDRAEVDAYLDVLNQRIADTIQATGFAFLMTTQIHGRTVLRLSICSHRTTLADIDAVFAKLRELGEMLDREAALDNLTMA